jgi:hypothetical protein
VQHESLCLHAVNISRTRQDDFVREYRGDGLGIDAPVRIPSWRTWERTLLPLLARVPARRNAAVSYCSAFAIGLRLSGQKKSRWSEA